MSKPKLNSRFAVVTSTPFHDHLDKQTIVLADEKELRTYIISLDMATWIKIEGVYELVPQRIEKRKWEKIIKDVKK